jgi:periplasmic copper chaperone A
MMKKLLLTSVLVCGLALGGVCQAHEYYAKNFKVIHPWGEPSQPSDKEAKVFLSFEDVQSDDVLLRASSPAADSVEFRAVAAGKEKLISELQVVKGDKLEWFPGKTHLVLKGLKAPLDLARSYPMTLYFKHSGPINVMISVGAH